MNKSRLFDLAIALLTPFFVQPAQAEMLFLGTASTGQTVTGCASKCGVLDKIAKIP